MKVRELIERLQRLPQDLLVVFEETTVDVVTRELVGFRVIQVEPELAFAEVDADGLPRRIVEDEDGPGEITDATEHPGCCRVVLLG